MTAHQAPHPTVWRRLFSLPRTRLGWWSVGLAAAFVMLFVINAAVFLPAPGAVP